MGSSRLAPRRAALLGAAVGGPMVARALGVGWASAGGVGARWCSGGGGRWRLGSAAGLGARRCSGGAGVGGWAARACGRGGGAGVVGVLRPRGGAGGGFGPERCFGWHLTRGYRGSGAIGRARAAGS